MSTGLDEKMMVLALEEARAAKSWGDVPIGAVVTRDGEVLARAGNARERDRDPTAHAEILALRAAAARMSTWHLESCTLYVTSSRARCAPARSSWPAWTGWCSGRRTTRLG